MGKQVGNEEKPFMFRKSIYGKSDSKGARPRVNVFSKQYQDNWDRIFKKEKNNAKKKDND